MFKKWFEHSRGLLILCVLGFLILGGFAYQSIFIARQDFYVAHHFQNLTEALKNIAIFLSVAYGFLWFFLRRDRRLSARTVVIVALIGFGILALIALATHPTRSQDIYWSLLLAKGFSYYGINPYQVDAGTFSEDAWAYPVLTWKDIPMIYGPIWTLFVAGVTTLASSLGGALILVKLGYLLLLIALGFIIWKILTEHGFTARDRSDLFLLFAWNPFLIQAGLIDLHNDIFIMVAIAASYYFLLRKKYGLSILALFFGGLVKYSPLLLVVIPLFYWIKDEYHKPLRLLGGLLITALITVAMVVISYSFFGGLTLANFIGLSTQIDRIGLETEYLSGTAVILKFFELSFKQLRLLGVVLAISAIAWCIRRGLALEAYVVPFLSILFFTTPWFQPWYLLWIFPLILVAWPNPWFIVLTSASLLMPELVSPSIASLLVLTGATVFFFWRFVFSPADN